MIDVQWQRRNLNVNSKNFEIVRPFRLLKEYGLTISIKQVRCYSRANGEELTAGKFQVVSIDDKVFRVFSDKVVGTIELEFAIIPSGEYKLVSLETIRDQIASNIGVKTL